MDWKPCRILSGKQMQAADALMIDSGMAGIDLMRRAGAAVFDVITSRFEQQPVQVLCGLGNNGGDGYVVAQMLHEAGWPVQAVALYGQRPAHGDALQASNAYQGSVVAMTQAAPFTDGIVVDALFGTGLARAMEEPVNAFIEAINNGEASVVSIDIPSGIDSTSARLLGLTAVVADITVVMCRRKFGNVCQPARYYNGEIVLADLGIPEVMLERVAQPIFENSPQIWQDEFPRLEWNTHKYKRGYTLVIGGEEMTGAARLASLAALRVGSGAVSVVCNPKSFPIYASTLTSVMVKQVPGDDLSACLNDTRVSAVVMGPGSGMTASTISRTRAVLARGVPTVLDADALNVFGGDPQGLTRLLHKQVVMTPHQGEFEKVFQQTDVPMGVDPLISAREAARYTGVVVVLKGANTYIASPTGEVAIYSDAPPTLATAGSGDVLAGMCAGLMAQGMEPFAAACAAVWMHGEAAHIFGPGLIAEDLPNRIPDVLGALLDNDTL